MPDLSHNKIKIETTTAVEMVYKFRTNVPQTIGKGQRVSALCGKYSLNVRAVVVCVAV